MINKGKELVGLPCFASDGEVGLRRECSGEQRVFSETGEEEGLFLITFPLVGLGFLIKEKG